MTIKLLDYARCAVEVDVGELDSIGRMSIEVLSGDEVLTVIYKDFTVRKFDSCNDRLHDFFDNEYEIYNATTGESLLNEEQFMNRTDSYWYMDAEFGE